jgi:sugar (pentulose or hexulose) kinase
MVATNAVARRTGNVSAGTSIFAMVVLERELAAPHPEIDLVTTPAGDLVAMVHCNNGASELDAWAGLFAEFAEALGARAGSGEVFEALFRQALAGEPDAGGLLAYNYLAGEPITGLDEGRPLVLRTPDSRLTLANFMRAQLLGVFGTLALGMRILDAEGVALDSMFGHGGVFKTAGVAQRLLAAALDTPVTVAATAGEGGPWGMAVLAAYLARADDLGLAEFLAREVFADAETSTITPDPADVAGFARYLARYERALPVLRAAVETT